MGFMKSFIGREHLLMDEKVCYKCFSDDSLINFIKSNGKTKGCSFCKARATSHNIGEVIDYINDCISHEYENPVEEMAWDSAEGGYHGASTYDSWEILDEVGLEVNSDGLFDSIASNLPNDHWCQKHPYQLREHEEMLYAWEEFSKLVKFKCRYMFLKHEKREGIFRTERILISKILNRLASSFKSIDLFTTLGKGTVLYRARYYGGKHIFPLELSQLAPPPGERASNSRMSPAGISMFYVAKELETAYDEIGLKKGDQSALAKFVLKQDLVLIDLTKIPAIPSIFSELRNLRDEIIFLHDFLKDFTKPIHKDGREHIEYVPTQIVSEFCKYNVKFKRKPIAGFIYPSATTKNGTSYCLFLSRKDFGIKESGSHYGKGKILVSCKSITLKTR